MEINFEDGIVMANKLIKKLDDNFDIKTYKKLVTLLHSTRPESDEIYFGSEIDCNFYYTITNAIDRYYNKGYLNQYSDIEYETISNYSYILPLILANDHYGKIKMTGDNGYIFLCQFHNEKTPSLAVYDLKNFCFCYGCHESLKTIKYLSLYEGISFKDALNLLCQIYMIKIDKIDDELTPLVTKYRTAILSEQYKELLYMGKERIENRNNHFLNYEKEYDNRFDTIDRVANGEYIDPKVISKKYKIN